MFIEDRKYEMDQSSSKNGKTTPFLQIRQQAWKLRDGILKNDKTIPLFMKTAARVAQEKEKTMPLFSVDPSAAKVQKTQKLHHFLLLPGKPGSS